MENQNLLIQITEDQLRCIVGDEVERRIKGHLNRANERYLTRNEAARHLKITLPTLDKVVRTGKLRSYKIGGRVLLKLSDVNQAAELIY